LQAALGQLRVISRIAKEHSRRPTDGGYSSVAKLVALYWNLISVFRLADAQRKQVCKDGD
jgi:hypothetical protein